MKKRIKALLFDMDGVISRTEEHHVQAYLRMFKERKIPLTRKELLSCYDCGGQDINITKCILKKKKLNENYKKFNQEKLRLVLKLFKKGFPQVAGAKQFIKTNSKRYKFGLASQSWRIEIHSILSKLKISQYFKKIVGKDDVRKYKPNPNCYKLLAKKLRVKPSECLVFEDSKIGITAAKRAKMKVVALNTSLKLADLKQADYIIKDFNDEKLKEILKIVE